MLDRLLYDRQADYGYIQLRVAGQLMARQYELSGDLSPIEDTIDFWRALVMHIAADVRAAAGERILDVHGFPDEEWLEGALDRLMPLIAALPLDTLLPGFSSMPKSLLRRAIWVILVGTADSLAPLPSGDHFLDLHLKFNLDDGEFADFVERTDGRRRIRMKVICADSWSWSEFQIGGQPDGKRIPVLRLDCMSKGESVSLWSYRPLVFSTL